MGRHVITGALPYNHKVWRAVRSVNIPLLMTEIWLYSKRKVWRAVRPVNSPLMMTEIWLLSKFKIWRAVRLARSEVVPLPLLLLAAVAAAGVCLQRTLRRSSSEFRRFLLSGVVLQRKAQ